MGWDLHHKLVTNADHFTADGLLAALNEILEGACNYSPRIEPTEEELASLSLACSASSLACSVRMNHDMNKHIYEKFFFVELC